MKLNAKEFLAAIKILKKVIPPATMTAKPILKMVRIAQSKNRVSLTATDIENTVEIDLHTQCDPTDAVLVPFEIMEKTGKAIKKNVAHIDLSRHEETITASVGALKIKWECQSMDEYPNVNFTAKPKGAIATLPGTDVVAAITKVSPAISRDDTRYSLTGMCIKTAATYIDFVCTDTERLHRKRFDRKRGKEYIGIIRESGAKLIKAIAAQSAKVKFYPYKAKYPTMLIVGENMRMTTMLIDTRYPAYENIIPSDLPISLTGDNKAFMAALQEITPFINTDDRTVEFSHDKSDQMILSTRHASLPVAECKHTGIALSFDIAFLKDILRHVEAKELVISIRQDAGASLLRIDDGGGIYLLAISTKEK